MKQLCRTMMGLAFILAVVTSFAAAKAVPGLLNFQGHLTDGAGNPLTGTYPMVFYIYDGPYAVGSNLCWAESHPAVSVQNGQFSVLLGDGSPVHPLVDSVFRGSNRWLSYQVGSDPESSPRIRLASVPYAFRTSSVDSALGGAVLSKLTVTEVNRDFTSAVSGISGYISHGGSGETRGVYGRAENGSSARTMGGYFYAPSLGTGQHYGVYSVAETERSASAYGVFTDAETFSAGDAKGGYCYAHGSGAATGNVVGMEGVAIASTSNLTGCKGVVGRADSHGSTGAIGGIFSANENSSDATGSSIGVYGYARGNSTPETDGVVGHVLAWGAGPAYGGKFTCTDDGTGTHWGVYGRGEAASGAACYGGQFYANGTGAGTSYGIYSSTGTTGTGTKWAGYFFGNVNVVGNLSKSSGSFLIDHPLDPENKYLQHSFVESPDMMNIYNGNVVTNTRGEAIVTLPDYFGALNEDFRYQLTVIGQFAQAIVAEKITNNRFTIRTDKPNVEVSWQVTGIRKDAWAEAHRIQVEIAKTANERGRFLTPEELGFGRDRFIIEEHHATESDELPAGRVTEPADSPRESITD